MRVAVLGATGFVGSHLLPRLVAEGDSVLAFARDIDEAPTIDRVTWYAADCEAAGSWQRRLVGCDAVVHLVARIRVSPRESRRSIADTTQHAVDAAKEAAVPRFVYLSANGAAHGSNPYADAKATAEDRVRASGLGWSIFRPSILFGEPRRDASGSALTEDFFLTLARTLGRLPALPIFGDGQYRLAPLFVGDLVAGISRSLEDETTAGKTFTLCGPKSYTYEELLRFLATAMKLRRVFPKVPIPLVRAALSATDWIHGVPLTRTELDLLVEGNECQDDRWRTELGVPVGPSLEEVVPRYV
jgi:NADH dehydrogenase